MKRRITVKDLSQLTAEQKRRLNELWTPDVYDVAVARVLKNVATDEYDEYAFVVGGISIHGTSIYLTDLVAGANILKQNAMEGEAQTKPEIAPADPIKVSVDPFFGESYPAMNSIFSSPDEAEPESDEEEYGEYDEEPEEMFSEEDLEDNYQRLETLHKEDCLPLLTIGDMIDILQRSNYGKHDFFLTASTYEIGCELGRGDSSWGGNIEWEPAELCDVLWASIKEIL